MRSHYLARVVALFTLALLPALTVAAAEPAQPRAWKVVAAPLLTRWAKDVRPERVRPEYPRPLAQRKEWLATTACGTSTSTTKTGGSAMASYRPPRKQHLLVPFTYEAALSGIGKDNEIHERVWYHRRSGEPLGRFKRVQIFV